MRKVITAAIVAFALAACNAKDFPILYPDWDNQAPAWAVKSCGPHPVLCSDGGCCWRGFECTSNTFPPMYAYDGYCRWVNGDTASTEQHERTAREEYP